MDSRHPAADDDSNTVKSVPGPGFSLPHVAMRGYYFAAANFRRGSFSLRVPEENRTRIRPAIPVDRTEQLMKTLHMSFQASSGVIRRGLMDGSLVRTGLVAGFLALLQQVVFPPVTLAQNSATATVSGEPESSGSSELLDFGTATTSLVYFVGSVEWAPGGRAVVDLGDAHTVKVGEEVAVFRSRDNHVRPLGKLVVRHTFPNFFQSDPVRDFNPEVGDFVIFVRTVPQLGTARLMRETYLTNQRIANQDRNGYSSMRNARTAQTLTEFHRQQPKWVSADRKIAGFIYGDSATSAASSRTTKLLNQVDLLRQLNAEGLPAVAAAGPAWQSVFDILAGPSEGIVIVNQMSDSAAAATQIPSGELTGIDSDTLRRIRSNVESILFERKPEERVVATVMCACMLQAKVLNEEQWLRTRLGRTQFPRLDSDNEYIQQIAIVMQRLRQQP